MQNFTQLILNTNNKINFYDQSNSILEQNKISNIDEPTILETIELFLRPYRSEQTIRAYKSDLIGFFNFNKIYVLSDLRLYSPVNMTNIFFKYLESISKTEPYQKDHLLNPKTVNRKAYSISSFFNFLISNYNYPFNPTKTFKQHEVSKKSTTESLTKDEIMLLLNYTKMKSFNSQKDMRDYLIMLFLASMALRRNELINLKWSDIDKNNVITIFQKGRSIKKLPIPNQILDVLIKFKNLFPSEAQHIFRPIVNNRGKCLNKPLSGDNILKLVETLVLKVLPEKKHITPHSFRKSFIEISLTAGVDISSIRNATGHTNLDALRYYDGRDEIKNNAVNYFFD